MEPLVSQEWLAAHLGAADVRVVDCRFVLGQPDAGRRAHRERHIAGAAFVDLDETMADPVGDGRRGRHPLPAPARFEAGIRAAGISADTTVIAYDEAMSGGAARLWWLLRHFGHSKVAVLDGGLSAWRGPTGGGEEQIAPGSFIAGPPRPDDVVDADDVAARLTFPERVLIDARAGERYRGEVEPLDPVPGHIPGARNAPYMEPLPEDLLGTDRDLVVYCGSGVTACVTLLRLAAAGRDDAKLYPGSYSEWSTRGLPTVRVSEIKMTRTPRSDLHGWTVRPAPDAGA